MKTGLKRLGWEDCLLLICRISVEGKAVPLQAWNGPEGSRNLRFPDYMTTAQDGGKVVALRTGRPYPQEMLLVLISVRGRVEQNISVIKSGEGGVSTQTW